MRKCFDFTDISEKELSVIQHVKEEQGFLYDTQAIRFIIMEYEKLSHSKLYELSDAISGLEDSVSKMRQSVRRVEENTNILIDTENTICVLQNIESFVPTDLYESVPIHEARKRYLERISHLRQERFSAESSSDPAKKDKG